MHTTPKLHDYQNRAIDFAVEKKCCFLAMDMGLGKTIVTLKAIERLGIPAIVFAPIQPMYSTWPAEIEKWGLSLTYDILHNAWKDEVFKDTNADVVLINYDGLKWFYEKLLKTKRRWGKRMLVLDESSMIKSHSTQRFKMLKRMFPLWDDYRICLSATPAPNGYHELWTQYYMLDQGESLYGAYSRFRGNYFHYSGPPLFKTTLRKGCYEEIKKAIEPITFRLKAEDYLDMPEYIHNEIPLALPEKYQRQYKLLEDQFFLEFEESEATAYNAAALSMKLRQYIQGAVYVDDGDGAFQTVHNVKLQALKELIEGSAGQPVLCPIQFKFELQLIRKTFGKDVPCIAGATKSSDATRYIKEWNRGELPLLLCHPASLGHGVNLQSGGHIVLWYALTLSLEQYKQLNGRIYRQGQKSAVVVNHFILQNTIDERVMKVLKDKDRSQEKLLNALRR